MTTFNVGEEKMSDYKEKGNKIFVKIPPTC